MWNFLGKGEGGFLFVKTTPIFSFPARTSLPKSHVVYLAACSVSPQIKPKWSKLGRRSPLPTTPARLRRDTSGCWRQALHGTLLFFSHVPSSPGNPGGSIAKSPQDPTACPQLHTVLCFSPGVVQGYLTAPPAFIRALRWLRLTRSWSDPVTTWCSSFLSSAPANGSPSISLRGEAHVPTVPCKALPNSSLGPTDLSHRVSFTRPSPGLTHP